MGSSTHVAFTALICEHRNANISVSDLFQLFSVMVLESGIRFDLAFFVLNTAVSGPCLVLVVGFFFCCFCFAFIYFIASLVRVL